MTTPDTLTDLPPVFVAGYPGDIGGADTECWHTAKLWRRFGLDVTFIPTSRPPRKWYAKLEEIGCRTVRTGPEHLRHVDGLCGGVVVSFCNGRFLGWADRFRRLGCKIVWVNCMTWLSAKERQYCQRWGPFDVYIFQSRYQQEKLLPQLAAFGVTSKRCFQIHGALDWEEFPFHPLAHEPGTAFVIGRISRPDLDKFAADTWSLYGRIGCPIKARVMGWCPKVEQKLGPPPDWAQCLPAGGESPQEFFSELHCMVQVNGGAEENWPRSGLEAMASGVPVVAQNQWGWRDMIRHGETGFLCDTAEEIIHYTTQIARDEGLRLRLADEARRRLEQELANPEPIGEQWRALFCGLS